MNSVTIIGRLTKDAVFGKTKAGTPVASFYVASDKARRTKEASEPNIIPVELYGKEGIHEYLKKGTPVALYGARIQTDSYKNKEGNTVYTWTVIADRIDLLPEGKMTGSTNVDLIGRLTSDCGVSYTKGNNTCVTEFSLAVDRSRGKEKRADFIRVKLFGKLGETLARYLVKGKLVNVKGRLDTGSYKRSDGTTVYTWDVVADDIFLLGDGRRNASESSAPPETEAKAPVNEEVEATGFMDLPDEFDEEYFDEPF